MSGVVQQPSTRGDQPPIPHPYHPDQLLPPLPDCEGREPAPGENHPTGRTCAKCGAFNQWWVFNPFVRAWRVTYGWALSNAEHCRCPGNRFEDHEERLKQRERQELRAMNVYGRPWDQRDADRVIGASWWSEKTFASFRLELSPRCREVFREVEARSRTAARPGVLVVGPPGVGKGHLIAAMLNAERWQRKTVALLTDLKLGALLTEAVTEENRTCLHLTRRVLREVDHLGILNLFADVRLPSESRAIQQLLEERQERGLATSVTVIENPLRWRKLGGTSALIGTRLLQVLHGPLIVAPDTNPPVYRALVWGVGK